MNEDMSNGVLRQRRNLILLCAVLGFYKIAGVDLGSASSLVNATPISVSIGIKNISAIYWGLLGLTVYFWIRYFQYFCVDVYPNTVTYIKNIYYGVVKKHLITNGLLSTEEVEVLNDSTGTTKHLMLAKKLAENSDIQSNQPIWSLKTLIKFSLFDPYILNYWLPFLLPVPVIIYFLA